MPTLIRGHRPGLYVGERGDVVCAEHAPGGDTWDWGHYLRVTVTFERLWLEGERKAGVMEVPPRCETCGKNREEAEACRP